MFHTRHFPGLIDTAPPPAGETIGPGGDFLTIAAWWADVQSRSPLTSPVEATLLDGTHDQTSGSFPGFVFSGVTADAVNTITLRGQNNHGGAFTGAGARVRELGNARFQTIFTIEQSHLILEDLVLENASPWLADMRGLRMDVSTVGFVMRRCLVYTQHSVANASQAILNIGSYVGGASQLIESCAFLNFRDGWQGNTNSTDVKHCISYGSDPSVGIHHRGANDYGCIMFNSASYGTQGTNVDRASDGSSGTWTNRVPADELENPSNDPTVADVRLKASTTTLKDVVSTNHGVATDFLGTSRPQGAGFDCGAHEII